MPVATGDLDAFPWESSRDGRAMLLVLSREREKLHHERVVVWREGEPETTPLTVWSGRMRNPSWSPDGRWVALESDAESFGDIVRVDLRTRAATRLTSGKRGNYEPSVSPDGSRIAFVSSRGGNAEVYVMRADGGDVRRLTASPRDSWSPRWSPDGSRIAFVSNRGGRDRVYVIRADGTALSTVTGASGEGVRPDATRVLEGEGAPVWSPDGRRLLFLARAPGGHTRAWISRLDGGAPLAISPAQDDAGHASWSPDGRLIAIAYGGAATGGVYLVRATGGGWTRVGPSGAWLPRWSH